MAENNNQNVYIPDDHMYMYDLGWLVKAVLNCESELTKAIELRTIHYADPIEWSITTQYQANTVVVDANTGTAYISSQPVPGGVLLSDTKYWSVIFNYADAINKLMSNIASNEHDNLIASKSYEVGDLVWYQSSLYRVIKAMAAADTFVVGTNIVAVTIADQLKHYIGLNRTANISGTDTLAAGSYIIEVTGVNTLKAANYSIDVDGDYTIKAENASLTAADIVEHSTGDSLRQTDGTLTETADHISVSGHIAVESTTNDLIITFKDKKNIDLHDLRAGTKTPYDYGAVGDGKTDDSAAFNAALAANTNVYIPSGTYYIAKTISLNPNNNVIGESHDGVIITYADGITLFEMANYSSVSNVGIETNNGDAYAFVDNGKTGVEISNVFVRGGSFNKTTSRFLHAYNGYSTLLVYDCLVDCGATDGYAVLIEGVNNVLSVNSDTHFERCFIDALRMADTTGGAFAFINSWAASLEYCLVRTTTTARAISVLADNANGVPDLWLTNCDLRIGALYVGAGCICYDNASYAEKITAVGSLNNKQTGKWLAYGEYSTLGTPTVITETNGNISILAPAGTNENSVNGLLFEKTAKGMTAHIRYGGAMASDISWIVGVSDGTRVAGLAGKTIGKAYTFGENTAYISTPILSQVIYSTATTMESAFDIPDINDITDIYVNVVTNDTAYTLYISRDGQQWAEVYTGTIPFTPSKFFIGYDNKQIGQYKYAMEINIDHVLIA